MAAGSSVNCKSKADVSSEECSFIIGLGKVRASISAHEMLAKKECSLTCTIVGRLHGVLFNN